MHSPYEKQSSLFNKETRENKAGFSTAFFRKGCQHGEIAKTAGMYVALNFNLFLIKI